MPLKYSLVTKILKDYGFIVIRSKGSHFRFEKGGLGLTVGFHKEFPPKTAKSMLNRISEITGNDYKDIIKEYKVKL